MNNQPFGQSDIVKLSDEDASVALLERAVTGLWEVVNDLTRFRRKMWAGLVEWARQATLIEGSELASDVDFEIPRCVNTIEETVALIRESRAAWLAAQQPK